MSTLKAIVQLHVANAVESLEFFVTADPGAFPVLQCRIGAGILHMPRDALVQMVRELNEAMVTVSGRWSAAYKAAALQSLGAPPASLMVMMEHDLAEMRKRLEAIRGMMEPSEN